MRRPRSRLFRRPAQFLIALVILIAGLPLAQPAPRPNVASGNYLIVFAAALDIDLLSIERGGIYIMRPDGSGLRQLTRFQTISYDYEDHGLNLPDDHPAFSPDGKRIVFTSNRADPSNWEIYVMDVNGSNPQRLTNSPGLDTEPVFSPDGSLIVFCSERGGNLDIWVMNADGTGLRQLTATPEEEIEPAWSPDGTQIAFTRLLGSNEKDVYIMNVDGSNVRRLTSAPGEDHDATFSPDGTQLVITSERDGTPPFGDVFKIRVSDGASLGNLTSGLEYGGGDPAWSPDGTQVAFFRSPTSVLVSTQMWVMNADGTNYTLLKEDDLGLINVHPNWGIAADSDVDGRPDYLENDNTSFTQRDLPSPSSAGGDQAGDQLGVAVASADLTHDGLPEMIVGIPGEDVDGLSNAGRVAYLLGSPLGPWFVPAIAAAFPLSLDAEQAGGTIQANGRMGQTLASCDFNGDGFTDIAIGAPGQNRVFISTGIDAAWQARSGTGHFGAALAAGDFNRDGKCDLAIAAPQEFRITVTGSVAAGAVRVFFGTSSGLATAAGQVFDQGSLPVVSGAGLEEAGDLFGAALAAGDFNSDGAWDLAVGVPGEDWAGSTSISDGGLVYVLPGKTGLPLQLSQAIARDGRDLPSPYAGLQAGARFGETLAIGDFNQDTLRADELVVGIPRQNIGSIADAGLVAVFSGNAIIGGGLIAETATAFTSSDAGGGAALSSNRFGTSLAVGDFSGDSISDLAVSAPNQAVGSASQAGQVYIIFGAKAGGSTCQFCIDTGVAFSGGGLAPAAAQRITQAHVGAAVESGDRFGGSLLLPSGNTLAAGDLDGDGQDDLLIGTPEETVSGLDNSGLISLRYGVKVGAGELEPASGASLPGQPVTFTLTWEHPERWRELETLHLRLSGPNGIVFWARFDEASTTFSLLDPQSETFALNGQPGEATLLEIPTASLDLAGSTVTGSGPAGRGVTLSFRVIFKEPTSGFTYRVELMATDDRGNSQGFDDAGSWGVGPFVQYLPLAAR